MRYLVGFWRLLTIAAFVGGLALSPEVYGALKVARLAAQGAFAEIHLQQVPPQRYGEEIGAALAAGDAPLARSLVALAGDRGIALSPDQLAEVAALPAVDLSGVLAEGWNCLVNGDFESEAGFACVIAADISGVGDVRDLLGEGGKAVAGQPVDYLTLGLAGVGLTLSASTYASLGGALPLRAGASFVKAAHRVGKLPRGLANEIGRAVARGIDREALDETLALAAALRLDDLQRPLSRMFRPASTRMMTTLAGDFGTIAGAGGVKAMKAGLRVVESSRDVSRVAKTARTYGDRFINVAKLVGRGMLGLGELLFGMLGWLLGALGWIWGMASMLLRALSRVGRRRRALPAGA